jgi:hypothetical protein
MENKTIGFWQSWWTNAAQDSTPNSKDYAGKENSEYVEVPCGRLTPVITDIIPQRRIHFLSLDVGTF